MADIYINRRLRIGEEYVSEREALDHGSVLVVLAEPGAGKSMLLSEFGRLLEVAPVRASRFRHQTQLAGNTPLIIDALDEAAKIDQSSVDQVVVKAQEFSNGRVIFASRSSEWQQARADWIRECFGTDPIIVRIEHLTREEQEALFVAHLPGEDFALFSAETDRFELSPLLGNPQFLLLFADAYIQSGRHFTSKAQIFRDAVERLAIEAGGAVALSPRPPSSQIIIVASEIMAKLLLSGASGVSSKEQLADIDYPYLMALAASDIAVAKVAIDTKLFKPSVEPDWHEPVHRIVAEYCAAQFIVRRIGDPQSPFSLRRALAVIAPNGAVRDELRGLLGWMASVGTERIQRAAISLDAYAVIANGDPSQLATASKRLLLEKLALLVEQNPGFRRSDHWRRFSVGGFFTEDLAVEVGRMLSTSLITSPLVDLLLELLVNSGGPASLLNDIRLILLNPEADQHTRLWAGRAAQKIAGQVSEQDLNALSDEATSASLRVAADLVESSGAEVFGLDSVERLLRAYISIYPSRRNLRDDSSYMASYYLSDALKKLPPEKLAELLDRLTVGLSCTCGHADYDCRCRNGVSKVAGILLDHYFETSTAPHEPDRVWGWMKSLWYESRGDAEKSASIRTLAADNELRHQLHIRAFSGISTHGQAWDVRWNLTDSHHHSGLAFYEGDDQRMADFAFEANNPGVWSAFWSRPAKQGKNLGPDGFRRHLRQQAAAKVTFAAEWARRERNFKTARLEQRRQWERRQRRWGRRNEQRSAQDRAHLLANRAQVESGNHWGWVRLFSNLYFSDEERLSKYTDDPALIENALRNALPLIAGHIPTIEQLARNEHSATARVAFVSCWIQFKDRGNLEHIDPSILLAAKVESGRHQSMSEEEYDAFQGELDRLLFSGPGQVEAFARAFIEPGLNGSRDGHTNVWWLSNTEALAHLRPTLSLEWLRKFPAMPVSARDLLFNIAAIAGDRAALIDIIEQGIRASVLAPKGEDAEHRRHRLEDMRFWQLRRFFFENSDKDGWDELRTDSKAIFAIADKAGRFGDEGEGWPGLSADKVFKILDAYVEKWPAVHLPSTYGSSDPPEESAYRFLTDIVWRIGRDVPERALSILDRLLRDTRFAGFFEALRTLQAEAIKKLALSGFNAPAPQEVIQMFYDAGVASVEDLRAFAVEELEWLQRWLRTADTDPLATFYQAGAHVDENTARNRVVDSLQWRMTSLNMPVVIEHHMSGSNRCDFTVSSMINGRRRLLVVEAKGQWHPALYTAAAAQLNERYASHQDAEQQGIYLVFWFGPQAKVADRIRHNIKTAQELQGRIVAEMPQELRGLIDVVVLDLTWSEATVQKDAAPNAA